MADAGRDMPVLLADIGGTHARFALADPSARAPLRMDSIRTYAVDAAPSLAAIAQRYLDDVGIQPQRAVFAVAGPVEGDSVRMTNHPWVIERSGLRTALSLDDVQLVNDFAAQAMALPLLQAQDVAAIGPHGWKPFPTNDACYAIVGPGTGLGVAALLVRDGMSIPMATEGGHVGFAPRDGEEAAILATLAQRYGRVSNERILCGDGLANLHWALGVLAGGDTDVALEDPAQIAAQAAQGEPRCARAQALFCSVYGSIAGDCALGFGAWDGVFLGGGITPKMLPQLRASEFRSRFEDKGRYRDAIAPVPTLAVIHPEPGLLGAAAIASGAGVAR